MSHATTWMEAPQGKSPTLVAKFGDHRHYDSGDIMVLVCHVNLQDHVTYGSINFMGDGLSR